MIYKALGTVAGLGLLILGNGARGQAVDDFLACGEITDRVERVICLEEALDAATPVDEVSITPREIPEPDDIGGTESLAPVEVTGENRADDSREREAAIAEAEPVEDPVEEFGRESATVVANEEGEEELYDQVVELEMARPNMWVIRLASGQVWRQTHPRRFNLREGEQVRIYPSSWGENFRLQTERLSGFIQVVRID